MRLAHADLANLASRQTTEHEWRATRDGVPDCSDASGAVERRPHELRPDVAICAREL
jgi:hypothetical protein